MPIGLMTGAPGESRFLLEDASILIFFELPAPRLFESASGLRGWLKQKVSFPRETNRCPVACHQYKARCHCTHCVPSFLALAFSSSIAFTIHCSMADTTVHDPAIPVVPPANPDDSRHDSEAEKHCDGCFFFSKSWCHKNGEVGDSRTHRPLQEDDHDRR